MTEHYQKAIDWLQDREAEALLISDMLQRFPEAAEHELPATIEWIIQQIEQANENWLRTSTDTAGSRIEPQGTAGTGGKESTT